MNTGKNDMKAHYRLLLLLSMTAISGAVYSQTIVGGEYESSDGKYNHIFEASGDYKGKRNYSNSPEGSVEGVFEQGEGICANTDGDRGNVKFYVEVLVFHEL